MRIKIISSIKKMLSVQNNQPNVDIYDRMDGMFSRKSDKEINAMMGGWMRNHPALFNQYGVYVM